MADELHSVEQSDTFRLTTKPEPALPILRRSVDEVRQLASEKQIDTVIDVPAELCVEADASKLVQVGVNLLSNAVKFSPPGSRISIRAEKKGNFAEFKIQDSGCGIPRSKLTDVFEPYYQVKSTD